MFIDYFIHLQNKNRNVHISDSDLYTARYREVTVYQLLHCVQNERYSS